MWSLIHTEVRYGSRSRHSVSKATLLRFLKVVLSFENSATAFAGCSGICQTGVTKAVCESTGGYERPVVGKLRETALNVQVAHPVRVRAFARAADTRRSPTLSMPGAVSLRRGVL